MAYAIFEDSGTQFKVQPGDTLKIDLRDVPDNTTSINFDKVLLVSNDTGVHIGEPVLSGATVSADIIGQVKADKIYVERFTRRKGFHRRVGHRQKYIAVKVTAINV